MNGKITEGEGPTVCALCVIIGFSFPFTGYLNLGLLCILRTSILEFTFFFLQAELQSVTGRWFAMEFVCILLFSPLPVNFCHCDAST